MTTAAQVATLRADLDRASLRLKLATSRANWADAILYAKEAARLEEALIAARADDGAPRNIVGTAKVRG